MLHLLLDRSTSRDNPVCHLSIAIAVDQQDAEAPGPFLVCTLHWPSIKSNRAHVVGCFNCCRAVVCVLSLAVSLLRF